MCAIKAARDKGSRNKNAGCGELLPQFTLSNTMRAPHKRMNARDSANESKAFDVYRSASQSLPFIIGLIHLLFFFSIWSMHYNERKVTAISVFIKQISVSLCLELKLFSFQLVRRRRKPRFYAKIVGANEKQQIDVFSIQTLDPNSCL